MIRGPRLGPRRPTVPQGGDRGRRAGDGDRSSGVFIQTQVALPKIYAGAVDGGNLVTPELAGGELHGVASLPLLVASVGVAVGEQKRSVHCTHYTTLPPHVSR